MASAETHQLYPFYILIVTISSKLFFMLSGALLLPVKKPIRQFLPHRLKVILFPLAFWSALYFVEMLAFDNPTKDTIKRYVISIFFNPIDSTLWFVYAMIGFYVMMPLISKCVTAIGKKWIEYYLVLWLLSAFIPFMGGVFYAPEFHRSMFASVNNLMGYLILGYYLNTWKLPIFTKRHWWKFAIAFIVVCIGIPLFVMTYQSYYLGYTDRIKMITDDLGINTIFTGILIFVVIQHFSHPHDSAQKPRFFSRLMAQMSICTFGIYLCHMLVFRHLVWNNAIVWLDGLDPLLSSIICAIACFAISYTIIRLIYCLPFSRYIIGH